MESCIGRFPIATNETYTNKTTGEKVSNTEKWHNVVVRNKAAEICEKYLNKGDKIYVEGKIKTRKWQSEDGVQRYSQKFMLVNLIFYQQNEISESQTPPSQFSAPETSSKPSDDEPDDLPFNILKNKLLLLLLTELHPELIKIF